MRETPEQHASQCDTAKRMMKSGAIAEKKKRARGSAIEAIE